MIERQETQMGLFPHEEEGLSFGEHVRLVIQMDGVTPNIAKLRAWEEGPTGYHARCEAIHGGFEDD